MNLARRLFHIATLAGLVGLGGCNRTVWVEVDASGCNEARVSAMNQEAEMVHQMGAVCALNGKPAAANRLRCHGQTLQVACRE